VGTSPSRIAHSGVGDELRVDRGYQSLADRPLRGLLEDGSDVEPDVRVEGHSLGRVVARDALELFATLLADTQVEGELQRAVDQTPARCAFQV
jgi:hypothetical protein